MNNFIIYAIEIAISLALFYSAYWVFLKNETFFKLNRFYLLSSVAISLLMPLLNITVATNIGNDSFIARYLVLPIEQYEQSMIVNMDNKNIPVKNKKITPASTAGRETANLNPAGSAIPDPAQTLPLPGRSNPDTATTNWLTLVFVIYFTGAALFLIRFMANFIWIFGYVLKYKPQQISGMKVIRSEKNISPFSFLNFIFISQAEYPAAELNKIISHEKVHISQKHSIDLVLFELLLVFQWFNPFAWSYKRAIKITHEYLADQGTLNSGVDLPGYQYSLLNQVLRENNLEMTSNYNLSIKKRITMMMKKRSTKLSALKLTIALPVIIFLFGAFAFKTSSSQKEPDQNNTEMNTLTANSDTIRKVFVSVDYLRLLEGDYVSTNEAWVRKIRFTEVLGTLIGNDNGYRYRLNPVGEGKFINPDDNAPLVFDTKDKNAITLLLFGKVKLQKVKMSPDAVGFPKRSVAYAVADVIEKDGIDAALLHYKKIKGSAEYDLSENEMNLVGYLLLWSGRAKEAVPVFKLNVEAFPHSFNVYDSYGEALMAVKDNAHAIESYMKSVKINPGSKGGIQKLKELGVNTDTLVKKVDVSVEYLKSLEGEYVSTNEPKRVRRIRFVEEDGVLEGNDNGYRYKLMPMGEGKFINPDDGASLVFDTKDRNAITLSLFGTINLKKLKKSEESIQKVDVPLEYLKLLAGEYIATNDPKKIRFEVVEGVLVGNDDGYRCKLIPVGKGKFINPDDNASFVFDTKNKNAITLLLFGKINLKKVK